MPEGPELHLASQFINNCCRGHTFAGPIVKSEVHKSEDIKFQSNGYTISARSRGKEIQLHLCSVKDDDKKKPSKKIDPNSQTTILFRFGMSGKFEFTSGTEVHKHSHLKFYTKDKPLMVLSYVDVRRFGRFEETTSWGRDRGPDPMFEYQDFRSNFLSNLMSADFGHPICEVLLNQKYFNGIGNYLRAEILYRARIPPFEQARKALEGLPEMPPDVKPKVKGRLSKRGDQAKEEVDILHLCHSVPLEVVNLGSGGYDSEGSKEDYDKFTSWLQCYYKDGMKNMADQNGRTIWYSGPAGPMAPKGGKSRKSTTKKKTMKNTEKARNMEGAEVEKTMKMTTGLLNSGAAEKREETQKKPRKVTTRTKNVKTTKKAKKLTESLRRSGRLKTS